MEDLDPSSTGRGRPIRVYVVEDHGVMRDTLREYLGMSGDIQVCGLAASAEEASTELTGLDPSVVLLDLSLPGRSGLELLAEIRLRSAVPCVVLSGHGEQSYVSRAFAAGADGYVLKGNPIEIPRAVRTVHAGQRYVSGSLRDVPDDG